jgi:hypothetical protein
MMLNSEKLLAYDPGNIDRMLALVKAARAAGMPKTTTWIESIMNRATR